MPEMDDEQSAALLDLLHRLHPLLPTPALEVWRELVNGRWLVMLRYGPQTYCLLPLSYSGPATDGLPEQPDKEHVC